MTEPTLNDLLRHQLNRNVVHVTRDATRDEINAQLRRAAVGETRNLDPAGASEPNREPDPRAALNQALRDMREG